MSGGGEQKCIVELSEIIIREMGSNTWNERCRGLQTIFRVPKERMHAADKSTYKPTFISFGPYHGGKNATEEMQRNEQGKLWYLNLIVGNGGPSVVQYTLAVASMETKARMCYEGEVEMDRDAFCKMLLLDAFQLILLFIFLGFGEVERGVVGQGSSNDSATASDGAAQVCNIIKTRHTSMTVRDLMMLENQIPSFVVEKIYDLRYCSGATAAPGSTKPIAQGAWETIKRIMTDIPTAAAIPTTSDAAPACNHLVHMCQMYLKPTCLQPPAPSAGGGQNSKKRTYGRLRRATEYYVAGVKFRQWDAERPLLDICFSNGVLRMAHQTIDDKTGYILRNVLAYEQKYYQMVTSPSECYVTSYVIFMSQILNGPEDVALLARRGIMNHFLRSDGDVCALFQGLADGLVFHPDTEHYLNPVGVALQGYCRSSLPRWRAWIVRHRFSNPWLVAAWVFGASAVLGTIVQTVYTLLGYYHHT